MAERVIGQSYKLPVGLTLGYRAGERGSFYLAEVVTETRVAVDKKYKNNVLRLKSERGGYYLIHKERLNDLEKLEPLGKGQGAWKRTRNRRDTFEFRKSGTTEGVYGFAKLGGWVVRKFDETPFGATDIVEPLVPKTKEEALEIAEEYIQAFETV